MSDYVKNVWVDQDVERPRTYQMTQNQDGSVTLVDDFGLVTELGTPVDEVNMNHIEEGIFSRADKDLNYLTETGENHFANPSLSNLNETGQAVLDNKATKTLSNVSSIDNGSAVKTALDTKVDKAGDTMTGQLKFVNTSNSSIFVENDTSDTSIIQKNTNDNTASSTSTPSVLQLRAYRVTNSDNNILGDTRFYHDTDNSVTAMLYARNYKSDNNGVSNYFGVRVNANGSLEYRYPSAFTTQLKKKDELGSFVTAVGSITATKKSITEPANNGTFTANEATTGYSWGDGWIYYQAQCSTGAPRQIGLVNNTRNIIVQATSASAAETIGVLLPVRIGDVVKVQFTAGTSSRSLSFVPNIGTATITD